jgi:hypothetical protein
MKRLRLSIGGMMSLVLVAGFGAAALANATPIWASITFALALAVLLGATLGAIAHRGARRVAWMGFAAFGWTYLVLAFGPLAVANGVTAPPFPTLIAYEPLREAITPDTRRVNDGLSVIILDRDPRPEPLSGSTGQVPGPGMLAQAPVSVAGQFSVARLGGMGGGIPTRVLDFMQLRRILHALGAIGFGLVGALVGGVIAIRDRPAPAEQQG